MGLDDGTETPDRDLMLTLAAHWRLPLCNHRIFQVSYAYSVNFCHAIVVVLVVATMKLV